MLFSTQDGKVNILVFEFDIFLTFADKKKNY